MLPDAAAQAAGSTGQQAQPADTTQGAMPDSWDAWLVTLPEDQRPTVAALFEGRVQKVHDALKDERENRKALEKQLTALAGKAEEGSEAKTQLTAMVTELERATRRADFLEAATKPDIGVSDTKAAWLIVNAEPDDYLDKRGNVNFTLLRERHPGLFGQKAPLPKVNAGNGTGQDAPVNTTMNDFIRRARG